MKVNTIGFLRVMSRIMGIGSTPLFSASYRFSGSDEEWETEYYSPK